MSSLSLEYARALYSLTPSLSLKHEIVDSLETSISIFSGDIYKFFMHPEIKNDEKKKIIMSSFNEGTFRDFLCVLIDNNRLNLLEEIKEDYQNLLNEEEKKISAICYSKEPLTTAYLDTLKEKLELKLNKKIILENKIDKTIIGGIRITYESNEIDMTLNTKLNELISKLKE